MIYNDIDVQYKCCSKEKPNIPATALHHCAQTTSERLGCGLTIDLVLGWETGKPLSCKILYCVLFLLDILHSTYHTFHILYSLFIRTELLKTQWSSHDVQSSALRLQPSHSEQLLLPVGLLSSSVADSIPPAEAMKRATAPATCPGKLYFAM
jgi:hypothetical protein